jgi:hypothetical protein
MGRGKSGRDYAGRLEDVVANHHPIGSLNPVWVEALMGFPHGWSDVSGED